MHDIDASDRMALDIAGIPPGATVLDVGCGSAKYAGSILERIGSDGRLVGIDPSESSLAEARSRCQAHIDAGQLELRQASAESLPFEPASFDLIWMSFVGHHLANPGKALRELARVARPRCVIAMFDTDLGGSFPYLPLPPDIEDAVREANWRAAMDAYGGKLEEPFDPFFGRRMMDLLLDAGWKESTLHAIPHLVQAPLTAAQAESISTWITRWFLGRLEGYLAPDMASRVASFIDWTDPASPIHGETFFFHRTWFLARATLS